MSREGAFTISVGTNGVGKSWQLKKLLKVNERNLIIPANRADKAWHGYPELKWRAALLPDPMRPGKNYYGVVIDELNTFKGTRVLHVDGQPQIFHAVCDPVTGYRNGGLFPDDFRNYVFSNGKMIHQVDGLFRNRRHFMLDIFMACHRFGDITADLYGFNPHLFIFKTTKPPEEGSVGQMANEQAFLETVRRVNERAIKNPHYFERFIPAMQ